MRAAVQVLPAQVRRVLGVAVLARVQVRRVLRVPAFARVQVQRVLRVPAFARVRVLARMTRVRAVRSG